MPSAKRLLKAFYLASRRVRVSGVYSTDMPISALDSMCVIGGHSYRSMHILHVWHTYYSRET